MLSAHDIALLAGDNPAVISTNAPGGAPTTLPTWFLLSNENEILLSIDAEGSRGNRLEHLRIDPAFSLIVMNAECWTDSVSIAARAVEFVRDTNLDLIDQMARKHGKGAYDIRRPRTAVRARIEGAIHGGVRPRGGQTRW